MAFDQERKVKSETLWNIAGQQAQHIMNLLTKATRFYLDGNIGSWFYYFVAIRQMINYELTTKQEKDLDKLETSAMKFYPKWKKYARAVGEGLEVSFELKKSKQKFLVLVKQYQREVMKLLKELGYFPSKDDRSKLNF